MSPLDIICLGRLVASTEEQDDGVALRSEVDAVAGTIVDPQFRDALPYWPGIPEVAFRYTLGATVDPKPSLLVLERLQPQSENGCLIDLDHAGKP